MPETDRPLKGQVALITGSSRKIGRSIALSLARDGCAIVVHARNSREEAEAVAAEVREYGVEAIVHLADVTDEQAVAKMFVEVKARLGRLNILVNNAANRQQTPLTEMSLAEWQAITGTILDGAFLCTREALPLMLQGGQGTVVYIGGMTAHTGAVNRAHVSAAKAGLVGLTKAVAVEFGPRGITANCVVPGKIGGARVASAGEVPAIPGREQPLVGREGRPEEVAAVVRTLCLPTGRFITGQTLHVNGGLYRP